MFRSTCVKRTVRSPVSDKMIVASQGLSRVLGGKNEKYPSVNMLKNALASAKTEKAQSLLKFGIALNTTKHGQVDEAIELCDSLVNNSNLELARSARSLKARCLSSKLEAARNAALVSGAANEDAVSAFTGAVDTELKELVQRNSDWGAKMSYAEFLLATPHSFAAVEAFGNTYETIASSVSAATNNTTVPSTAAKIAHLANYESNLNSVEAEITNKNIASLLSSDKAQNGQLTEAIKQYTAELADAGVSTQEVISVAISQASTENNHHFMDFFGDSGDYALWSNAHCTPLANRLNGFVNPGQAFVPGTAVLQERVGQFGKPTESFVGDESKLLEALEKNGDVLANISSLCGSTPSVALTSNDETYFATTKMVDEFSKEHPPLGHGSDAAEQFLVQLQKDSLEQVAFRAAVGKAVAFERNDKLTEAISTLDLVIQADKYLHMWKAYLARGRTHRALGNIDAAEQDFKVLHSLKTQEGFDIPQLDENRYKSIF